MKFLATGKAKFFSILAVVTALALSFVPAASATETAAEYGKITEGASTQISAAVPIALETVGLFVGIMIAYKLIRRMLRA